MALAVLCGSLTPAIAQTRLVYTFVAGEQRTYDVRSIVTEGDQPAIELRSTVTITALREDRRATWLLLTRAIADSPPLGVLLTVDQSGRRTWAAEMPPHVGLVEEALDVLPQLPSAAQREATWTTTPDLYGRRWHCRREGVDAARGGAERVTYTVTDDIGIMDLYGVTAAGTYWFDADAGVLARLEQTRTDARARRRVQTTVVLRGRRPGAASWAARRAVEAAAYTRALKREHALRHQMVNEAVDGGRMLERLDQVWVALKSDVQADVSPFDALVDGRRVWLRSQRALLLGEVNLGLRWAGQWASKWSLQDCAGDTHVCEDVRRGVVIECYWSSASVWGLRALPALVDLRARKTPDPVAMVFLNVDRDFARACRAIAYCGGGLEHLPGGSLHAVERFPRLPIVRVVDGAGVVRGVWVGWEPEYGAALELAQALMRDGQP
jgi:hypothetical protein